MYATRIIYMYEYAVTFMYCLFCRTTYNCRVELLDCAILNIVLGTNDQCVDKP